MYVYDITVTHCVVDRYNLCKTITVRHTSHNFYLVAVFLAQKDNSFEHSIRKVV